MTLTSRSGYIRHYRKEMDSAQWQLPAGQYKVWRACCLAANIHESTWWSRKLGQEIKIPRGAFITTQRDMAVACRVSRSVVRAAWKNLERLAALHIEEQTQGQAHGGTLVTVTNFDAYQAKEPKTGPEMDPSRAQDRPKTGPGSRRREVEKFEKGENTPTPRERVPPSGSKKHDEDGFEASWTAFPRKDGKDEALAAWRRLKPSPELVTTILKAIEVQKKTDQWVRGVIPHLARWLDGRRWQDEGLKKPKKDITLGGQPTMFLR